VEQFFAPLLERLAMALEAAGIRYMVIGGQAVIQYGQSRLTEDIDITLDVGTDDWRLADALLRSAGFVPRIADYELLATDANILLLADRSTSIRIDVALAGSAFEEAAFGRVVHQRIGKTDIAFVSPEDLVVQKLVAGRERDHDDVRRLLRKQKSLDRAYVERWLRDFGAALDRDLVAEFNQLAR